MILQKRLSDSEEYPPSEDTFFIATHIESEKFSFVVGTDINFNVLKNQTYKTPNLVCCNGSDAIVSKFDLIVCNLPYLATEEVLDIATDGGAEGFEIPKKIFDSVIKNIRKGGKFVFVTSSLSNYQKLINYTKELGLEPRIIAKKKLFFEELILVEAKRK